MMRWMLLLALLGCRTEDDCERAVARLVRIDPASAPISASAIEQCRKTGPANNGDPVLRCAIDSSTDASAAECIDRGVREVVRPRKPSDPEPVGVNPLLQP